MRTIKFRAKTTANGHWVYGSLMAYDDNTFAIRNSKSQPWVHPDTVGQFTGLLDRDGKEIYEGDIVEYSDHRPTLDSHPTLDVGEVKYESGALWLPTCLLCEASSMRIIGNIHDNPKKQKL